MLAYNTGDAIALADASDVSSVSWHHAESTSAWTS